MKRKSQSAIFHATTPAEIGEIEKAETTQIANKKLSGTRLEKRLTTLVCSRDCAYFTGGLCQNSDLIKTSVRHGESPFEAQVERLLRK